MAVAGRLSLSLVRQLMYLALAVRTTSSRVVGYTLRLERIMSLRGWSQVLQATTD